MYNCTSGTAFYLSNILSLPIKKKKKEQRVADNNIGSCWVRKRTTLIELKAIFLLAQLQQGFMHYYSDSFYE